MKCVLGNVTTGTGAFFSRTLPGFLRNDYLDFWPHVCKHSTADVQGRVVYIRSYVASVINIWGRFPDGEIVWWSSKKKKKERELKHANPKQIAFVPPRKDCANRRMRDGFRFDGNNDIFFGCNTATKLTPN